MKKTSKLDIQRLFFQKIHPKQSNDYFYSDQELRDLQNLLTKKEIELLHKIVNRFKSIQRFQQGDDYLCLKLLSLYSFFKSKQPDFRKSILTGVVPSDLQFTYNKKRGTIIAINSERISTLLKRSRNSFKRYLDNSDVYEKISSQTANHLFSAKGDKGETQGEKIFSICNIMKDYEVGTTFYFVKNMPLNNSNIEIRNLISELTKKKKRKYFRKNKPKKNNSIFLQKWKKIKSLENDVQFYKKEIKEIKEKNEKFVKKLKSDILSNLDIQNCVITAVKNYLEVKKGLLKEQIFEYAFLIKFCSSSAYRRLWIMSQSLLPPPTTVDSHYKNKINILKKQLTDPSEIVPLLDSYWKQNYKKIGVSENLLSSFKIELTIGIDAASLTSFNRVKNDKNKDLKFPIDKETKKRNSNTKLEIVKCLLNGTNQIISKENGALLPDGSVLQDSQAKYFFAILLQPLDWRLPIMAIQIIKSISGHITLNEYQDILTIFTIINNHRHFSAHCIASDGEQAFNKFHLQAYERYKSMIDDVLNYKCDLNSFVTNVFALCKILPILDMLHGVKCGRSKIMNNKVKLGNNCDWFSSHTLMIDLKMFDQVLKDQTAWGKMRDIYPLKLFNTKNAVTLFEKNKKSAGFYILLYSLIIEVFRNIYLNRKSRLMLADICLYNMLSLLKASENLPDGTGFRIQEKSKNKFVYFNDKAGMIKLLNTLIAVCNCLRNPYISDHLGLERLSSHPVEQFFGRFRNHFNGQYKTNSAFSFAIRAAMSMEFETNFNVVFSIPKRENFAGAHLNFTNFNNECFDIFNIDFQISESFLLYISKDLFNNATNPDENFSEDTIQFINEINNFFNEHPSNVYLHFSLTKGSRIYPQLVAASENKEIYNCKFKSQMGPILPTIFQLKEQISITNEQLYSNKIELWHLEKVKSQIFDNKTQSQNGFANNQKVKYFKGCLIPFETIKNVTQQSRNAAKKSNQMYLLGDEYDKVMFTNFEQIPFLQDQIKKNEIITDSVSQFLLQQKQEEYEKLYALAQKYVKLSSAYEANILKEKLVQDSPFFNFQEKSSEEEEYSQENVAPDSPMILNVIKKQQCFFYDTNNLVIDPAKEHFNFKNRVSWTNEDIQKFVRIFTKYPKKFRIIAKQFPSKSKKDIVEFYYKHKIDLELKRYEIHSKKKGMLKNYYSKSVIQNSE